jgi:cell division protease FtsH
MDKLAEFLIEKETITGKEFMKIFREIKGIPEPEEDKKEENTSESIESQDEKTISELEETTETSEETANEVEMPTESFEELFQLAKDAVETDAESEAEEETDREESEETKALVRGNYSNVSLDNLWKDLK